MGLITVLVLSDLSATFDTIDYHILLHTHTHTQRISASVLPDVDECTNEPNLCSPHGKCLNTEGSYQCVCDSGFTANLETPTCDGKMNYK